MLRATFCALVIAAFAQLTGIAVAQVAIESEILCPEKAEPLLRVQHGYGIDKPPTFVCWYKAPRNAQAGVQEVPETLEVKGKCRLKQADQTADMRGSGSSGFVGGFQTCIGERRRCAVTCRPE